MTSESSVVTLWQMLKFNAHRFVKITTTSAYFQGVMKASAPTVNRNALETVIIDKVFRDGICEGLRPLMAEMQESDLVSASDLVEDMIGQLKPIISAVTWADYFRFDSELNKRIEHELKRKKFYQLKTDVAEMFDKREPFGPVVSLRFSAAAHDVSEACSCFACERYDASVFHLMRAMEVVLRDLAHKLGIPYLPSWDSYLKKIDEFLKSADRKSTEQRQLAGFFSEASALLRSVKDAWRNDVMHVESRFGPDQSRDILRSVKAFMIWLSKDGTDI